MSPTPEQLAKLPKWARESLTSLQRERDIAVRSLNEYVDNQTKSAFYIEHMECLGEQVGPSLKVQYVQTRAICCRHKGIELRITAFDTSQSKDSIRLQWYADNRSDEVAMIPESFQACRLVARSHMYEHSKW